MTSTGVFEVDFIQNKKNQKKKSLASLWVKNHSKTIAKPYLMTFLFLPETYIEGLGLCEAAVTDVEIWKMSSVSVDHLLTDEKE